MKNKKIKKIVFAPDDKVSVTSHDFVWKLFNVGYAYITNESTLEDFEPIESIPGHKHIFYSDLPAEEQIKYKKQYEKESLGDLDRLLVWYPPITKKEWKILEDKQNEKFVKRIAKNYGVFVPEILDGETRIWKIVELIIKKIVGGKSKES